MKKILNLALVILAVLFVTSCTTGITTAVTTSSLTTNISEPELTTETLVETTAETTTETVVETAESRLFEEEIIEATESTTKAKTTTTTKKTTTATTVANKRQETGNGKTVAFKKGATVLGAWIEINGKGFSDCVIVDAPMDGTITSGVIWPWKSEMKGLKVISNDEILAAPSPTTTTPTTTVETTTTPTTTIETTTTTVPTTTVTTTIPTTTATTISRVRTPTGVGLSNNFQVGDTVVGWKITFSNGKSYEGGVVVYDSPLEGTITDGVINPWSTEITNQTVISSNQILS